MIALLLTLTLGIGHQAQPEPPLENLQFVMLMTAKDAPKLGAEVAKSKQVEHLTYLEKLWSERKALLVGPIENGGDFRGLIILKAKDKAEAKTWMEKDPWVAAGQMTPVVFDVWMQTHMIRKAPAFMALEKYGFAFYKRPKEAPNYDDAKLQEIQKGHMAHLGYMAKNHGLIAAGPLGEAGEFRGILVFRKADKDAMRLAVANDPAVKAGRLVIEPYIWYTSKGTFVEK